MLPHFADTHTHRPIYPEIRTSIPTQILLLLTPLNTHRLIITKIIIHSYRGIRFLAHTHTHLKGSNMDSTDRRQPTGKSRDKQNKEREREREREREKGEEEGGRGNGERKTEKKERKARRERAIEDEDNHRGRRGGKKKKKTKEDIQREFLQFVFSFILLMAQPLCPVLKHRVIHHPAEEHCQGIKIL